MQALEDDNEDLLKAILDRPTAILAMTDKEVLFAIEKNKPGCLKLLLGKGGNPNASDGNQFAIHHAALSGNVELVDLLCQYGALINRCDQNGQTAVHYAVYYQNLPVLMTLIYYNARLSTPDRNGQTAAHYAVYYENLLILRTLVMAKANIDVCDQTGRSPLFIALWKGNTNIIKLLLVNNASTDTTATVEFQPYYIKEVVTPIMYAAAIGHSEGLELMLEAGGNAHVRLNNTRTSALFYASLYDHKSCLDVIRRKSNIAREVINACEEKDFDYVKLLLVLNPSLNETDELGETAVTKVATNGCLDILVTLLKAGAEADPNLDREYGKTPLMAAALNGKNNCLKELLQWNVNIDMANEYGQTALWFAAKLGRTKCIESLLEAGASVKIASKSGTPLMAAIGKLESFKLLLGLDDVNHVNVKDECALTLTIQHQSEEYFNLLMKHKPDVDITNGMGWSPVMIATSMKKCGILKTLLDGGAKVDHVDTKGTTALHLAAEKRFGPGMKLLLAHKQDLDICRRKGRRYNKHTLTPLTTAIKANATDCVVQLLKHGAIASVPIRHSLWSVMTRRFQPKLVRALHAAGADPHSLPDIVHRGDNMKPVPLFVQFNQDPNHPTDIHDQDHDRSLSNLCRLKIRRHLFKIQPYNLFHSIPQLQLPKIIQAYLLFYVDLNKL